MRISDWSSDVCSSDLREHVYAPAGLERVIDLGLGQQHRELAAHRLQFGITEQPVRPQAGTVEDQCLGKRRDVGGRMEIAHHAAPAREPDVAQRSDEHTSELQSLMRISYAVFCLKKKNHGKY